ncbi:hypothetical protein BKN49_22575 [Pseudomonas aeruginosa]|nr:hypothetical protein BKN49_22575 [Pseudomonas aeruginosa]
MNVRMDKRLIELLNQHGARITWEQFRAAYTVRQQERYDDPKAVAARARELQRLDAELEHHRKAMISQ